MEWGSGTNEFIVWKILKDGEFASLHEDTFIMPDKVEYNIDLLNSMEAELDDPSGFFFKHIFPDIAGKYLSHICMFFFIMDYC